MSKGILGIGCSYTWGEGLYFYSKLDNLPFRENHVFEPSKVTPPMLKYKDKHKFVNLVAEYYNTWYWTEMGNGGTNLQFVNYLEHEFTNRDLFSYNDFSLVIFQFTHCTRDMQSGFDIDTQIEKVDKICKEIEKNNVKVLTLCWDEEIPNSILYKKLFNKRHIDITIDNVTKPAFDYFIWNDKYNITVASDFKSKNLQKNDLHFNHKGHNVISDLIIKKLKQDNFTI